MLVTHNHTTYNRQFAWLPVRTDSGRLLWLQFYYLRPRGDCSGLGIILSWVEFILDDPHRQIK